VNILADACLEVRLVEALRSTGHDVEFALDTRPFDRDEVLLEYALGSRKLIVTYDLDFGELVPFRRLPSHGVVLLRFPGISIEQKSQLLINQLSITGELLIGTFTVMTPERTRTRPLPPA